MRVLQKNIIILHLLVDSTYLTKVLNVGKNTGIFLRVWNYTSTFACIYNRLQFFLFFQSKTVFQPHRGDFKTLLEVFSFFVAHGLHRQEPLLIYLLTIQFIFNYGYIL